MFKKIAIVLYWLMIVIALAGLATQIYPALSDFFKNSQFAVTYPYSLDYGEGPLLDQTLRMARFENIYKGSLDNPPYTISNYPPVFPLLQVPFAWIFGPALWYGRGIAILSVLLAGLFIGLTLHTLTHNWIGALVGGLLLVAFPYIQHWSMFNRIDELALALSWAAIYVVVRAVGPLKPASLAGEAGAPAAPRETLAQLARHTLAFGPFWLAALLMVGAIYTRQTYAAAAPFAAFFWLIFGAQGSWKSRFTRAVLLGMVVGGITLGLFLLLNLATQGGFYLNIVVTNVNKFIWDTVWHYGREIRDKMWPLYTLGGAFLILEGLVAIIKLIARLIHHFRKTPGRSTPQQPPVWRASAWALVLPYALVALAVSVTVGKDGSNVNYLLEISAAMCLAGGAALAWALQWKRWYIRLPLYLVVIGMLAYQCTLLVSLTRKDYTAFIKERVTNLANVRAVAQIVKETPGIVLADEYMGLVALAGKPLYFQPFEYKQMADGKIWDEMNFLSDITHHKFDVILWYEPASWKESIQARWTGAQRSVIIMSYTLDKKIGDVSVYRPKK